MKNRKLFDKLGDFVLGKGFYIVLFLCAAVIGVSAWMMAAEEQTMEKTIRKSSVSLDNSKVETVIIPPRMETADTESESLPVEAPEVKDEGLADTALPDAGESVEVWREGDIMEVAAPMYVWPVMGELERHHSLQSLGYDVTLSDWRTHDGIDIIAPVGTQVTAAHCGTVESVYDDDLYGITVVVDHGDGTRTLYSNLAENPAVTVGDWLEPGSPVGAVGDTALCEIGQQEHLHFSISVDGKGADPLSYLPA